MYFHIYLVFVLITYIYITAKALQKIKIKKEYRIQKKNLITKLIKTFDTSIQIHNYTLSHFSR